ncbi:MAG TPA: serine protein kinase RIO [Candidatus Bathyarchaeota archaeon]|nr:serine protein kinase RIO [Candidatus Bathyarchaeota archaeon]
MSFRDKVDEKLNRKQQAYEIGSLMKNKRSEDYQVIEEVFDKSTVMTIYDFMNKGIIDELHGVVNAGKEARIYLGKDLQGNDLAVKIYLTSSAEFKKGMLPYIEGDQRFAHVRRDTRSLIYTWAQKEYKNLQRAHEAKVNVPVPIAVQKNVLIMSFIGKNGERAPLLKESEIEDPQKIFKLLLTYMKRLYTKAGLVHADLSEYNIMMWKRKPVIFDVAQSVLTSHPMADKFLRRDLQNVHRYFKRLDSSVQSLEEMYERVTGGRKY